MYPILGIFYFIKISTVNNAIFMCSRNYIRIVLRRSVNNYVCHKITFPENLVADFSEVVDFVVVYGNENNAVVAQEVAGEF